MIKISDDALKKTLKSALFKGNVLRTEITFLSTFDKGFKRFILLNNDFNIPDVYYVFTTSKVTSFINNTNPNMRGNYLFIQKGRTLNNLNEDMVIDCRWVYRIKRENLLRNFKNGKLTSLNPFEDSIVKKIEDIIKRSLLIPDYLKELVCSNY